MIKRPSILITGKRKTDPIVKPFCGPTGQTDSIRHAHYHYYKEVIMEKRPYEQYVSEFINGHMFHDQTDAKSMNEHKKNMGNVEHLLLCHPDIVHEEFAGEYEADYDSIADRIFRAEDDNMVRKAAASDADSRKLNFESKATGEMLEVIVGYVNRLKVFNSRLETEQFELYLDGNYLEILESKNNRQTAFFFHTLSDCDIICDEWKDVIEGLGQMQSRSGKTINHVDMSTALTNAKYPLRKQKYINIIEEMAREIMILKGKEDLKDA